MKKSLLYTRTGDAGTTSLIGGERVPKNSPRVCAYGTLDELNATIGLVQAHCTELDNFVNATLLTINNTLFNIGAYLATPQPTPAQATESTASESSPLPKDPKDLNNPKDPSDPKDLTGSSDCQDSPIVRALTPAIADLEHQIDLLDSIVPPLRQFVLPGGSIGASHAHVARTVCRRAEREILNLTSTGAYVAPVVLNYINRLSDYLFILARYINHFTGTPELTWRQ